MKRGVKAEALLALLAVRHSRDLFIPECKNGPTVGGGHRRLDAWAMRRSWAHPLYSGYEVKVSRSDFLGDEKWAEYLPLCHQLWFVCPYGLITPEEIPDQVGLLWAAKTGTRLYTKRKAARREIAEPVELLLYILMTRVRPLRDNEWGPESQAPIDYWRAWLATKEEKREVGHNVSASIRKILKKRVWEQETENRRLQAELEQVQELRDQLERLNLLHTIRGWHRDDEVRQRVRAALAGAAAEIPGAIDRLVAAATDVRKALEASSEEAT